ncbi:unnamed protein product [Linum trigynum]|uniref:Uncharacterized protein n=1 Tax=Linum trigynum TaxID=586398 RepID=A0AAV2DSF9_9ROSI
MARDHHATRRKLPARLTRVKTWETKARRQLLRRGEARSIKIGKREKLETAKSNHNCTVAEFIVCSLVFVEPLCQRPPLQSRSHSL